jgi:hypothetical protein
VAIVVIAVAVIAAIAVVAGSTLAVGFTAPANVAVEPLAASTPEADPFRSPPPSVCFVLAQLTSEGILRAGNLTP